MKKQLFNDNWKFWKGGDAFALIWSVPEDAQDVTLPHDAMIHEKAHKESPNSGMTGYRDGDYYTYVKELNYSPAETGENVILQFEGVYKDAFVFVNGEFAGKEHSGYTTFNVDISDFLKEGTNEIRVQVHNGDMPNSRWYSGGGIYRDVYLLTSEKLCIKPDGVKIRTENADEDEAVINVRSSIVNGRSLREKIFITTKIYDPDGRAVASDTATMTFMTGEKRDVSRRITVMKPKLWSDESPAMYRYEMTISDRQGKEIDREEGAFGIRIISLDSKRGLRVNGKEVKLRGACIHHDNGIIGAATYEMAEYRRVYLMKKAGFNAIRMSHHPMSPAMLRACDELGIYVMDELTDMWNHGKGQYDYGMSFDDSWRHDLELMVKKDYNHPCVILYSIGNEIPEIGLEHGSRTAYEISSLFHELDDTRYTTAGINGIFAASDRIPEIMSDLKKDGKVDGNVNDFMSVMHDFMDEIVKHRAISETLDAATASLDVAGYNYMTARYEPDGKEYPDRVIVGSETYPPEIARNWAEIKKYHHVIGDFTWTGWDYIGEAGVGIPAYKFGEGGFGAQFPCQLAYCGDFDITGYRRPASYFREAVFGLRKDPYITVQSPSHYGEEVIKTAWVISDSIPSWTYPGFENKPVIVEVYAAGDEVELLRNGESLGRKKSGEAAGYITVFETEYEPGELTAVCYENGKEIGRNTLKTTKEAAKLAIVREDESFFAGETLKPICDNGKLIYLNVLLEDESGELVQNADEELTVTCEGAEVLGFGSGDHKPSHNYDEKVTDSFLGRAQIILLEDEADKEISVKVSSKSGLTGELIL
ncbi:glycoside hydrolase family 2 TIM barrel-domain containing protein [Butyrivibrio sp. AE3006]|uniref:glycoside hydrolase family 2 TIM barrel-domain containing protein n=1 Tax=Butyrivibrio sp. AE3006 TaxID=1280673 RepID=UPI00041F7471|nr:glycoside hydrolase family 2 TIM barrel-domain containing protein [Butyrivibrio sp. AE3006]